MCRTPNPKVAGSIPATPAIYIFRKLIIGVNIVALNKFKNYLEGVKTEMRKVSWPKQDEVKNSTLIIIVMVIIMAVFLGAVDFIFTAILSNIM